MNKRWQFLLVTFVVMAFISYFPLISSRVIGVFLVGIAVGMVAETYLKKQEEKGS